MAASEYLSEKSGEGTREPLKAALDTGGAYVITVLFLLLPFFVLAGYMQAFSLTFLNAILLILLFTFSIPVAKNFDFKRHFTEMCAISLGIAALSFGIGVLVRLFIGIDV
jgi:vacuolar iron transporter family protein